MLNERTLPGVHDDVMAAVLKHCPPTECGSALDLGAGEGAISARLHEAGYSVEAVELEPGRFRPADITCYHLDLNTDFADAVGKKFDVITAVDVIEHLENHRAFLRGCAKLLAERGMIFVTSPNVECWNSRLIFLKHGMLNAFGSPGLESEGAGGGHINPLFSWQMSNTADELGFGITVDTVVGSRSDWAEARMVGGGLLNFLGKAALRLFLGPLMRGRTGGSTNLFVLEKKILPKSESRLGRDASTSSA